MRIGVVSDTHLQKGEELPAELMVGLRQVDMILHAGDLVDLSVVFLLEKIAPVRVVFGNMDSRAVRQQCPEKQTIEVGGKKIGLVHGSGAPDGLAGRMRREFDGVDMIVFGHSHHAMSELIDGVLMFNPGSPTDRRFAPRRTYGIVQASDTDLLIYTQIVELA